MRKSLIALAFLSGLPLGAQSFELGLFAGQQQYPTPHVDVLPGQTLEFKADSKTVFAVRFGYALVDLGPALFQLTAGYQPESKSTLTATLGGAPLSGQGELKESHWSAGAMFNFKAVIAVGAGLEFRSEKLSETTDSTTYNRVWARVNAGYAVPSPLVKPFFGIEAAFPLSTKSLDPYGSTADALKSLAPRSQFGVYAGVRF